MELEVLGLLEDLKPGECFTDSKAFVDEGLLDSFEIISLVSMLEEKYGIVVDGLDIVPDYFQSIATIIKLVNKSKKV